jgi:hypothetical protein
LFRYFRLFRHLSFWQANSDNDGPPSHHYQIHELLPKSHL